MRGWSVVGGRCVMRDAGSGTRDSGLKIDMSGRTFSTVVHTIPLTN